MSRYDQKIDEIKSRIQSTQEQNEAIYTMIERTKRMIKRARLERSFLLEKLEDMTRTTADGEGISSSPPDSPSDMLLDDGPNHKAKGPSHTRSSTSKDGGNRLPNAYSLFCQQERGNVIKELGDSPKPSAIQSKLSEKWKSVSPDEKKRYSELAKDLKKKKSSGSKMNDERTNSDEAEVKNEIETSSQATQDQGADRTAEATGGEPSESN